MVALKKNPAGNLNLSSKSLPKHPSESKRHQDMPSEPKELVRAFGRVNKKRIAETKAAISKESISS